MTARVPSVLTLNAGSSSIRFAVYEAGRIPRRLYGGKIDRIGLPGTILTVDPSSGRPQTPRRTAARSHRAAVEILLDWLGEDPLFGSIAAVGHRVVHGMKHSRPEWVTPSLLAELRRITPYDPDHLPIEIELIEAVRKRNPKMPQVACFDTAFHRTMPPVATLLSIPWRYGREGVERYGFHGLSYEYLMGELARVGDKAASRGRVILAHLGNGASLAAVARGKSVDTSMGFTPAAGLVMGTRSGDLDPGLLAFLARRDRMTPARFERMVNHESGLLGISGSSSDMRDLIRREATDARAAAAVALFCYQAKKWIGAYAAVLGGVDTLVFAGGIGENSPLVRARICSGLGHLGIGLGARLNAGNAAIISPASGRATVRVIRTDEEIVIARSLCQMLKSGPAARHKRG